MITFSDNIARKPYLGSTEIAEVWLGNTLIYPDAPTPPYDTYYLTFEALENGTFQFTNSVDYSVDGGQTWATLSANTNSPTISTGNKIMWKGMLSSGNEGIGTFSSSGRYNVQGNPMSLLFGDNFIGVTDLAGYKYAFYMLFKNNIGLINAKYLSLPATTLAEYCYHGMFYGCTNLINSPKLPATTLKKYCYHGMFNGCSNLVNAPALPATTMILWCYGYMFNGCSSLVNAPALPATTLAKDCYHRMFQDCTSLTTAPELSVPLLVENCYYYMFNGCSNLNNIKCLATDISASNCTSCWVLNVAANGTFTKAASMSSWTSGFGGNGIPIGWTVVSNS